MSIAHRDALKGYPSTSTRERIETIYAQEARNLDQIQSKIQFTLNTTIPEIDALRLSRAEQLIARYRPDRIVSEVKPRPLAAATRRFSEIFHYRSRRKAQKAAITRQENPYLLAEDAIAIMRKLRQLDAKIKGYDPAAHEETVLNQSLNNTPLSTNHVVTSISLSYVKDQWGLERICLDGIQNHLPSDSNGTNVWLQCLIDGRWVSTDQARERKNAIRAVRFVDNGVGFDSKNLSILHSTKADEDGSRGQFGEGMKMIAAAALRQDLGMVIESQNWRATPRVESGSIENTRKGTVDKIEQLAFDIEYFDPATPLRGSRTIFTTPTQEFINEILELDTKVLDLRPDTRALFVSKHGNIVSTQPKRIFVKGIQVTTDNTLFSYDFTDVKTNRDRNIVIDANIQKRVSDIISELNDKNLIKSLLQRSLIAESQPEYSRKDPYESSSYYSYTDSKYPALWKKAFEECFGADACIDTGFELPAMFDASSIRRIRMPSAIRAQLCKAGVNRDQEAIPDFHTEVLPTSLTLDYGKDAWKEQRMMLDAVQNHLPRDAGGSWIGIDFRTTDGVWHSYKDFSKYENGQIDAVKIADDGRGFDFRLLGLFGSTKDDGSSTGKFGEGLKMLSAASVRTGVQLVVRSRNWMATPRVEKQEIDGKTFEQLVFDITTELKKGALDKIQSDLLGRHESSSTVFLKPTEALLEEFRAAHQSILALEKPRPLASNNAGDILALNGGRLYVRDILIPGNHNLQYSYHLSNFDIQSRDRNHLSNHELRSALTGIWERTEDQKLIRDYLLQAANASSSARETIVPHDFDIAFLPSNPALWVKTFKDTFGPKTAFRDVASQDFNAVHDNQHLGLQTVTLPSAVCETLGLCCDENGQRVPNYKDTLREANRVEVIPDQKLTDEERDILRFLREEVYPIVAPEKGHGQVVAYEPRGTFEAAGLSGEPVGINRRTLALGRGYAADVYIHEIAHNETGASDADARFRNFLSAACARLTIALLDEKNARGASPESTRGLQPSTAPIVPRMN